MQLRRSVSPFRILWGYINEEKITQEFIPSSVKGYCPEFRKSHRTMHECVIIPNSPEFICKICFAKVVVVVLQWVFIGSWSSVQCFFVWFSKRYKTPKRHTNVSQTLVSPWSFNVLCDITKSLESSLGNTVYKNICLQFKITLTFKCLLIY